jgi:hypothetical protein
MEIVKKLTLRTMNLGKVVLRKAVPEEGDNKSVAKIVGRTTLAQPVQGDNGESLRLIGDFTGLNLLTGEIFSSTVCFIPNFVAEPLANALKESDAVEFAIEITAKFSEKSAVGYEFGVKPLLETKPTNAMQALLERSGVALPALTAPVEAAPEQAKPKKK